MNRRGLILAALGVAGVVAVGLWFLRAPAPPERLVLRAAAFTDLAGWTDDDLGAALPALRASCARLAPQPDDRALGAGGTVADWRAPCAALDGLGAGDARAYFETWFRPHAVTNNGEAEGLFTGYYEASLRGARRAGGAYGTPIHARPDDLVMVDLGAFRESLAGERIAGRVENGRLVPYASRADIGGGALAGRDLEMLWVDDPIDAFFLHIQGSGRVALDEGGEVRVGYAGQNGHPYLAIGRVLIEEGALTRETVSMQSIRAWLAANPERAAEVMNQNASYIFFREIAGPGPLGAQGVALTAERSLAVDRRYIPLGAPVWIDTDPPTGAGPRLRRLMVAQDTGGAIRGPVRGDVFWGHGTRAADIAG